MSHRGAKKHRVIFTKTAVTGKVRVKIPGYLATLGHGASVESPANADRKGKEVL